MNITAESYGQAVILNLKGELSADALEAFNHAVERQLVDAAVRDLVLNMASVPFVDSLGLECLLDLQQKMNDRLGQVRLTNLDPNVAKILEITRLESSFERFADVAEAVKNLQ